MERGDFKPFYLPTVGSFSGVKTSLEAGCHEHVSSPDTLTAAKGKDGELKTSLGFTARPPSLHFPTPPLPPRRVWNASRLMSCLVTSKSLDGL